MPPADKAHRVIPTHPSSETVAYGLARPDRPGQPLERGFAIAPGLQPCPRVGPAPRMRMAVLPPRIGPLSRIAPRARLDSARWSPGPRELPCQEVRPQPTTGPLRTAAGADVPPGYDH